MIVDAHLHLSIMRKEKKFQEVKKRLLSEMKKNRVGMAVVIPDNLHGTSCADLDVLKNILGEDKKFLIVATLRASEINDKNLKKIEGLFKLRKAVGFKIFPGHEPIYPTDKRWLPAIKLCEKYKMPFMIHTGINLDDENAAKYNDPKYIAKLAQQHPNLNIILCHYFWPRLDYCFEKTINHKNIFFDTSGLAHKEVIRACGGISKIKAILIKTLKNGRDRLIFGTDWPIVEIKESIKLINSLDLSKNQKKLIFSGNAKRIFGIKK